MENNTKTNKRRDLLGLQVCWMLAVPQPALEIQEFQIFKYLSDLSELEF